MKRYDIIEHFNQNDRNGNGLIIKGGVRKGKTTMASLLASQLYADDFAIISNIRFHEQVYDNLDNIYYITSDLDLFFAYLQIPVDKQIVIFWDDAQASDGFKSTDREAITTLGRFLIFLGKLSMNYILIAHQKYIPDVLLDGYEPLILYKWDRTYFYIGGATLYRYKWELDKYCMKFKMPPWDFVQDNMFPIMSKAIATFEWKVDQQALYTYMSQYEIGENLRAGVRDFLNSNDEHSADPYADLIGLSYEKIYMALCLKQGHILPQGTTIIEWTKSPVLSSARKKLREYGLE